MCCHHSSNPPALPYALPSTSPTPLRPQGYFQPEEFFRVTRAFNLPHENPTFIKGNYQLGSVPPEAAKDASLRVVHQAHSLPARARKTNVCLNVTRKF